MNTILFKFKNEDSAKKAKLCIKEMMQQCPISQKKYDITYKTKDEDFDIKIFSKSVSVMEMFFDWIAIMKDPIYIHTDCPELYSSISKIVIL